MSWAVSSTDFCTKPSVCRCFGVDIDKAIASLTASWNADEWWRIVFGVACMITNEMASVKVYIIWNSILFFDNNGRGAWSHVRDSFSIRLKWLEPTPTHSLSYHTSKLNKSRRKTHRRKITKSFTAASWMGACFFVAIDLHLLNAIKYRQIKHFAVQLTTAQRNQFGVNYTTNRSV